MVGMFKTNGLLINIVEGYKKMHYNLLFNGCSCTYGGELNGIDDDIEHQRTHRFSHLVAKHYSKTYDNIALNGKSNDWIVEKTINWFEEGNTCDLVVIQFADNKRNILYYDEGEQNTQPKEYDTTTPLLHTNKSIWAQFLLSKGYDERRIRSNIYYKNIYTKYMGQQNYYKNLFFLNNYFKTKNIPAIFLKLSSFDGKFEKTDVDFGWKLHCKNIKVKDISGDILPVFYEDIEKKHYCKNYTYLYKTKNDNPRLAFLKGTHPNEFGHQKIADYIIDNSSNIF